MCSSFCTPYDKKLMGESSMPMAVQARVTKVPCVIVRLDLEHASNAALEKFQAEQEKMQREQEAREAVKREMDEKKKLIKLIESRLGLVKPTRDAVDVS